VTAPASPETLLIQYEATHDSSDRAEIIDELGDEETADALKVLGRLFQIETDPELKNEILAATNGIEGQTEGKLLIIGAALKPTQPADVRDAAIDVLQGLDDSRAIPVWQTLLNDTDPEIRSVAKAQIAQLQEMQPR
jgi:HEAT repeat protein